MAVPVGIEGRLAGQDLAAIGKRADAGRRVNATTAPIPSARGRFGKVEPDAYPRCEAVLAAVSVERPLDRNGV